VSGQTNWGSTVGSINRYWYGTVALGSKKSQGLGFGSYLVNFHFRPLLLNYLNQGTYLLKAPADLGRLSMSASNHESSFFSERCQTRFALNRSASGLGHLE